MGWLAMIVPPEMLIVLTIEKTPPVMTIDSPVELLR
jgi:hypothetical protein